VAVGDDSSSNQGEPQTLAAVWDGTAWTVTNTINPGACNLLSGVSCISAAYCVAVGSSPGFYTATLVEAWDGSTWTVVPSPNPGGTSNSAISELRSVSCTSETNCLAVGGELIIPPGGTF